MFLKRNKQEIKQYLSMDIFLCMWLLYSPMKKIDLHRYLIGCILAFLKTLIHLWFVEQLF